MSNRRRDLYCENGCGHRIIAGAIEIQDTEVKKVSIITECPICEEDTKHIEDLTIDVSFRCTGCGQTKKAKAEPTQGQAKTRHPCGECERNTEWHEIGWEEINVS